MATNFSPCKGSYVLNQFPSNVMFGMNGFHVSASGAIQGHHGPLVEIISQESGFDSSRRPNCLIRAVIAMGKMPSPVVSPRGKKNFRSVIVNSQLT